jgi:DNA segregation ATPase FtsK/SpoIIIE-like protein
VVRETNAKPQDQDVDAKRIAAEKKQAERRKWAERKRRQQELEAATVEVRKIERGEGPQEVVQKDTVEMPRLGFFGQN